MIKIHRALEIQIIPIKSITKFSLATVHEIRVISLLPANTLSH